MQEFAEQFAIADGAVEIEQGQVQYRCLTVASSGFRAAWRTCSAQ